MPENPQNSLLHKHYLKHDHTRPISIHTSTTPPSKHRCFPSLPPNLHQRRLLMRESNFPLFVKPHILEIIDEPAAQLVSRIPERTPYNKSTITSRGANTGTYFVLSTLGSNITLSVLGSANQQKCTNALIHTFTRCGPRNSCSPTSAWNPRSQLP